MMKIKILTQGIAFLLLFAGVTQCKSAKESPEPEEDPTNGLPQVSIQLDFSQQYQSIDGFGFFGGRDVWWGAASNLWNQSWGDFVITDLGLTIWRNEIYPPATPTVGQDADWNKQLPVVQGLKSTADRHNVPLKFIASVWSPPADMKWAAEFTWVGDENATRWEDPSVSTKNGGTLDPNKYGAYADWLKEHLQLYKDVGIDLFALSLQNEPGFSQFFNSCTYTVGWYNDLLINVVPAIKSSFPNVQIFGSENMLLTEGKDENWRWFYHSAIKENEAASANLDILAVHGYSDGVAPNSGSELVGMWRNHTEQFAVPMDKKVWMSETSGYKEEWEPQDGGSGALSLGLDILAALNHGNVNAWVWWQGSQLDGIGDFNLMNGTTPGKKYYVSKQYYRYIRPEAVRIGAVSDDDEVFVTAFEHNEKGTTTIVIVNAGDDKAISLAGAGLPATFDMYRTSRLPSENCSLISTVTTGEGQRFVFPGKSIITLQAGGDEL